MRFIILTSFLAAMAGALTAEEVVEMTPFRTTPYDIYFSMKYELATDSVSEIRVTEVKSGSPVEKLGLRKGDCLSAIDGKPVVGRKRSEVVNQNQAIRLRGPVTFTGHRGIFRKDWSLTVDAALLGKKRPITAPESTTTAVMPPAAPAVAGARP